jgi:hypothetical protein
MMKMTIIVIANPRQDIDRVRGHVIDVAKAARQERKVDFFYYDENKSMRCSFSCFVSTLDFKKSRLFPSAICFLFFFSANHRESTAVAVFSGLRLVFCLPSFVCLIASEN